MLRRYARRGSSLHRLLRPPVPLVHNPAEPVFDPDDGPALLVGAAGSSGRRGFLGLDLFAGAGVSVRADLERLPFADDRSSPSSVTPCSSMSATFGCGREMHRVLRLGGRLHIVVPFNHPFHEYPADYRRWTIDGLRELLAEFEIESCGVRTGPTATLLTFALDYVKVVSPRALARPAYALVGWIVWPLRYLDLWLYRRRRARAGEQHLCVRPQAIALSLALILGKAQGTRQKAQGRSKEERRKAKAKSPFPFFSSHSPSPFPFAFFLSLPPSTFPCAL